MNDSKIGSEQRASSEAGQGKRRPFIRPTVEDVGRLRELTQLGGTQP
jgi:hypothetical protein